jgi:hypothetical protein
MWLKGNCENWTARFKKGFWTGSMIELKDVRTLGTLGRL